jgi:hypothetical protein
MNIFFQVLAALIVFAWLLGWAYDRALAKQQRDAWRAEELREERERRQQERQDLRHEREMRELTIGLENNTYWRAKLGRHLEAGDRVLTDVFDHYTPGGTDRILLTIIDPKGPTYEDYPGHTKGIRMTVRDRVTRMDRQMWIDPEQSFDLLKPRPKTQSPSEEDRKQKDIEDEADYRRILAAREAEQERRRREMRAEYDAWIAARPTMLVLQDYVRSLAADWLFPEPDLPPPDLTHNPYFGTDASCALNLEEHRRHKACLEIERREAGLVEGPWGVVA